MSRPLLACGCVAMGNHRNPHDGLPAEHPSCVAHFGLHDGACTVVESPDLTTRRARCTYYGAPTRHNECNGYGGVKCRGECRHEIASSVELPFFRTAPDKPFDEFYCGCHSWD